MSKVVRTVVQVGAVVAGIALAIPSGGTSLLAAKLGISSLAASAIAVGLSVGASLLSRPGNLSGRRAAIAAQLQLGEQPRQAIFGRAALGGTLVDAFNYGGKYGTDWEVMVIALADHRCDALEGFYVDDTFVAYTGDGDVPGFNGQLRVFWRNGAWGQEVPWILTDHGPGWTADDRGWNVAYAVVAYKADDEKAKSPVWTGGRPRFRFVVRGLRCYDPRKDSLAGGSGPQRWTNAETWEWSENPIVIRHNWVRGIYAGDQVGNPGMLLVGRGLSDLEAPPTNVFPRANLCDEVIEGQPRYRIGGLVSANEPFIDVEGDFAAAVAGVISQPEGAVEVDPGQARAAVAHFTDDDIIVGSTVSWSEFLGQQDNGWINTVVARFMDPDQRWNVRSAPVRRETADLIADRGPRETQPQLDFVTNLPQVQRIAEIIRRLGRLWARATVTLPPRFAFLEEGDWVTWQSDRRFGGATRTFRVEAWGSNRAWHHQLTLRQISASVFSDTDPLDDGVIASTRTPPPVVAAPGADAWSAGLIYNESGGVRSPAVRVEGSVEDPAAQLVLFEYVQQMVAPDTNTVWSFNGTSRPDVTRVDIPVTAGGRFWVGVAYSVDGILSDRRVLGPVDAGELSYADGTPLQMLQPAERDATQGAVIPGPGSELPGNIKDHTGHPYDPGELLNTAIKLTPAGRLEYRPLPESDPVAIGQIALPDLGAASQIDIRRAEEDVDQLGQALATALNEASQTRLTFTDAGFYSDPATGQVRIHAIEETRERVSGAEIRLNAAEANINLRATVNYVDQAIATAVFDPGQVADLNAVFLRLTSAELDIDGLNAAVTTLATVSELSFVEGRVTTAESAIDALEGTITTKVDTTTFTALETRVAGAESTLTAIGDTAQIVNAVRSVRLVERDQDANAEADLRAMLQGDRAQRDQVAAIASARQELRTDITSGLAAESVARLALQVRVGQVEATAATETVARVSGDTALAAQISSLSVELDDEVSNRAAAVQTANQARIDGDALIAAGLAQQVTAGRVLDAEASDLADLLLAALLQDDKTRRETNGALAAARQEITAQIVNDREAFASSLIALVARIAGNEASIVNESQVRAADDTAIAQTVSTLSTAVNGNSASIEQFAQSINGLLARVGVVLDVNGRVVGWELNNDGASGDFTVASDSFRVVDPDTGVPFIDADADGLRIINGRFIADNGVIMDVRGKPFGTSNQFISWSGPSRALSLCDEASALSYLKTNGDTYFGGSLSAGTISNAVQTTTIGAEEVLLGPFATQGRPASAVVSANSTSILATADSVWEVNAPPPDPYAGARQNFSVTYVLERATSANGPWETVASYSQTATSFTDTINAGTSGGSEPVPLRRYRHVVTIGVSATTALTLPAGDAALRMRRTVFQNTTTGQLVSPNAANNIAIRYTEQ